MKNNSNNYNVLLIILLFLVPLLTINISYYFLSKIEYDFNKKEQDKNAQKEADILASEANFSSQFSSVFKNYIEQSKIIVTKNINDKSTLTNSLSEKSHKIFYNNIPSDYNIYVFKIATETAKTDLLFTNLKSKNISKRSLSLSFDYLLYSNLLKDLNKEYIDYKNKQIIDKEIIKTYETNIDKYSNKLKMSKSFAKNFLGEYNDIDYLAKEMKGSTSFSKTNNRNAWFIWDYYIDNNDIYGFILLCYDINSENYNKFARAIALKKLYSRSKCVGAFIPLYKDFSEGTVPDVLKKSEIFTRFANRITIQKEEDINKWFINPFKSEELGNYTAYCSLDRGASHIAVVLAKSLKGIIWPKWLIFTNILLIFIFILTIINFVTFGKMPSISLSLRFTLSYALALVLPLSLISVVSIGYFTYFENIASEQATDDIQRVLKSFDSQKSALVKEYRATFAEALKDDELIRIVKKEGVNSNSAVARVVDIFENKSNSQKKYLPILGVKIINEKGEGAYLRGGAPYDYSVESVITSFIPSVKKILISKLELEGLLDVKNDKTYNTNDDSEQDMASDAFRSLIGVDLGTGISKHTSVPIPRKNGNYNCYQIYDFIKIDGKSRYILLVVWDNQTLDNILIKDILNEYNNDKYDNLKDKINKGSYKDNKIANFLAYKIFGQNTETIDINRHSDARYRYLNQKKFKEITTKDWVKLSYFSKKTNTLDDGKDLVVIMPALNFNNTVFLGWIDKSNIIKKIENRKDVIKILLFISLIILFICNLRSVSVFLKPISSLKKALDEVSVGNYNIGFKEVPSDELGTLSNEFSNMIDGLREKERISKLISEQAVKALEKNSSNVLNDTETFKGVALVSDIRNFTGMSEKYDPVLITDLLNEHFAEMTKIISDNGGYIYKFIGDAIEAVFPDSSEFEQSAYERSFKAGCLMIEKLARINSHRVKRDLFTYRIGVGLCSGEMYSGSVGSLDTRLDYSILGRPLKEATKFEALSIQNPSFPLVIDENIVKNISNYGFNFKALDTNGQNYSVFSLNELNDKIIEKLNFDSIGNTNLSYLDSEETKEIEYFSLFNKTYVKNIFSKIVIISFIIATLSAFISIGFYYVYLTSLKSVKSESERECSRLVEHLKSDEVLKSAFEALCFEFYEDINKLIEKDDTENFNKKIKDLCDKYKNKNTALPKVFCCIFNNVSEKDYKKEEDFKKIISSGDKVIKDFYSHGFLEETVETISNLAIAVKIDNNVLKEKYLHLLTGNISELFNLISTFYRRSAATTVDKEDLFLNTTKLYDKNQKQLLVYALCGFPKTLDDDSVIDYYNFLAGKNIIMAFKKDNIWRFSNNFPDKEIKYLKKYNSDYDLLNNKGYCIDNLTIGKKNWTVYCITRDLIASSRSPLLFVSIIFVISFLIIFFVFYVINYRIKKYGNSINLKLRLDIVAAAIFPLLIVSFISYLYVNEDYNYKKSELRNNLNNLINEVENKEIYHKPFCENQIKRINNELFNGLKSLPNNKNDKEYNERKIKLINDCDKLVPKRGKYNNKYGKNAFCLREFVVVGKDGIAITLNNGEKLIDDEKHLSGFSKVIFELGKHVFLKIKKDNNIKGELIADKFLEALSSNMGNEVACRIVYFPNNTISVGISYTFLCFYVATFPENSDADYVALYLVFFENYLKSYLCGLKNDFIYETEPNSKCSLREHFEFGSKTSNLYCFCSPIVNVGRYFFYDDCPSVVNHKEDFKALKELGLASSWINSSFLPVSRKLDIHGPHYLEMRKGDYIPDNIFAAIGSLIPLNNSFYYNSCLFAFIIVFSLILMLFITHLVTSDLLEPVKQLLIGAKYASKGKYNFKIQLEREDELGILCDSFNKMMKGLEDKQLMDRMVSKTALRVSANTKDISSKKEDVFLIYINVPDFGMAMKSLSHQDLFIKLRKHIATISKIVIDRGGDIDKIMGEKMLVVFHTNQNDCEDTAIAAWNAANAIVNNNTDFKAAVGINYGQVISGFLGVGEKRDFTVIGDPVNVAARIASLSEKLTTKSCLMSETFYNIIRYNINAREFGKVELKGKSQAMKVYQIV